MVPFFTPIPLTLLLGIRMSNMLRFGIDFLIVSHPVWVIFVKNVIFSSSRWEIIVNLWVIFLKTCFSGWDEKCGITVFVKNALSSFFPREMVCNLWVSFLKICYSGLGKTSHYPFWGEVHPHPTPSRISPKKQTKSLIWDKTVVRSSYHYNGISYTGRHTCQGYPAPWHSMGFPEITRVTWRLWVRWHIHIESTP